jgi:NADH:ubiquinone oxidoreductase subunit 3 (subunit A)
MWLSIAPDRTPYRKDVMSTSLYDGTGSQNAVLSQLAAMLETSVMASLALILAAAYAAACVASQHARGKFTSQYALAPLIFTFIALALAFTNPLARGNSSLSLIALLCLVLAIWSAGRFAYLFMALLNWKPSQETKYTPTTAGLNLLAATIWSTLGFTILQNSMSAHLVPQVDALHASVLAAAGVGAALLLVQILYSRDMPEARLMRATQKTQEKAKVPAT